MQARRDGASEVKNDKAYESAGFAMVLESDEIKKDSIKTSSLCYYNSTLRLTSENDDKRASEVYFISEAFFLLLKAFSFSLTTNC